MLIDKKIRVKFKKGVLRSGKIKKRVVKFKILELNKKNSSSSIRLRVLAGELEFRHLQGYTENICMFATQTIIENTKITKTGARHNYAKWFLLPRKLRAQFELKNFDFSNIKSGYIEYENSVYFIYRVDQKI